jgi:hypothetical protein
MHRLQGNDEILGHHLLAFYTPDLCASAFPINFLDGIPIRVHAMEAEDIANVGISGVGAPCTLRISDHLTDLVSDLLWRI